MFFWRRVAPQVPEDGLKPTATPGYTRNFREINRRVSRGKSFSGYERNSLFLNLTGQGFAETADLLGVDYDDDARAVARFDWDHDGRLDFLVTNRTAPQLRLLRNNLAPSNAFIAFRLRGNGTTTNRDAVGARLTLWSVSHPQQKQIRTIRAGDGFLSQSSSWAHFGLGTGISELSLTVQWPGGELERYHGLLPNSHYVVTQDEGSQVATLSKPANISLNAPDSSVGQASKATEGAHGFWVANRVPFPQLSYDDGSGLPRSTRDFLGQPVLVSFWATWCAPCLEELKMFAKNEAHLQSRGATVLALNVDQLGVEQATSGSDPEEVLRQLGYRLPHGTARQASLEKIEVLIEYLSSRRAPLSIPASFLIDAQGEVAAIYRGTLDFERLAEDLRLLDSPSDKQLARASARVGRWLSNPRAIDHAAYLSDYATRFANNGLTDEAERLYQLLKSRGKVLTAQDYYNQAKSAAERGKTQQAVKNYREAIRLKPDYGQALTGLGALLLLQKRAAEAEQLFQRALEVDPNHATALINLAMIERARGQTESSLSRLRRVVDRNPEFGAAQLNLGSLLASMNRHQEAIIHLEKAVELNPKQIMGLLSLAGAYAQTGKVEQAASLYRRLLTLNPRLPHAHFGLGTLLAAQGRHQEAADSFRNAISIGGASSRAYLRLGQSLAETGDEVAASKAFERAVELDPANRQAVQLLQQLREKAK